MTMQISHGIAELPMESMVYFFKRHRMELSLWPQNCFGGTDCTENCR